MGGLITASPSNGWLVFAFIVLMLQRLGSAAEWGCSAATGTFTQSTTCNMADEVSLSGDLNIVGAQNAYTAIRAATGKRHFLISSGTPKTLTLTWLNLTSGTEENGGSIYITNVAGRLDVSHCTFFNNSASDDGGAVHAHNAFVSLRHTNFVQNAAEGGGALYVRNAGSVYIAWNSFSFNSAIQGGAVFFHGSKGTLEDSSFYRNEAKWQGGGLYVVGGEDYSSKINLTRVQLIENKQTETVQSGWKGGGGLYLQFSVAASIRECTFRRNEALMGQPGDKHGHQIMSRKQIGNGITTLVLVNTNFNEIETSHRFYGYDIDTNTGGAAQYLEPSGCTDNACTIAPFNGSCSARAANLGVICQFSSCSAGTESRVQTELPPSSTCSLCPVGKWSSGGGLSCTNCTRGKYGNETGKTNEAAACRYACPKGRYGTHEGEASPATACQSLCPPGKHGSHAGAVNETAACSTCPPGRYSSELGRVECTNCSSGRYSAHRGNKQDCDCNGCVPGTVAPVPGMTVCKACTPGNYQAERAQTACIACGEGRTSTARATDCAAWAPFTFPSGAQNTEGEIYSYTLQLIEAPTHKVSVSLNTSSDNCAVIGPRSIELNDAGATVKILSRRAAATANGSIVSPCTINHHLESADSRYAGLAPQRFTLQQRSKGCGVGEYFGAFSRSHDTECICGPKYYKPPLRDCEECLDKGMLCNTPGITVPPVKINYWRQYPTSPDLIQHPFYKCNMPGACAGGNSTHGMCMDGHKDSSPMCAVCEREYVFQKGVCTQCKGYIPGKGTSPPPQMMEMGFMCVGLAVIVMYYYLTLPALTVEEQTDVRIKLSIMDIESVFENADKLTLPEFRNLMNTQFTDNEIAHVFHVTDEGKDGHITKLGLVDYTTDDGEIDIDELQKRRAEYNSKMEHARSAATTLGAPVSKFKILLTYVQIVSFLPVVFDLPFPNSITHTMKLLELCSLDIYTFFGEMSCHMQTTFQQKFVFHMLMAPAVLLCVGTVWHVVRFREQFLGTYCQSHFTRESTKARVYNLLSLFAFGLYAGISTKLFELFKCEKIYGQFYMVADYGTECYGDAWWGYGALAILCIIVYLIGIPASQLYVLWKNRKHLHETSALNLQAHKLVKKRYGSLYENYTEDCFYFELVNTFRKLAMTGGLILVSERVIVQALLGILVSSVWLLVVAGKFPYKAYWDNILEIALSFGLLMSLIFGFTLEMFHLKHTGNSEEVAFDTLLVLITWGCIGVGSIGLIAALPCCCRSTVLNYTIHNKKNAHHHTKRRVMNEWVANLLPVVKWLSVEEIQKIMKSSQKEIESKANEAFQKSQRQKKFSKIYPTKRISMEVLVRTNVLAKKRQKMLAMLPASDKKKKKPSLRSLGGLVKEHVKSKFRQRRLHHNDVKRIHEDREKRSHHLKRKQDEMVQLKEKRKLQLEKRLQMRKK